MQLLKDCAESVSNFVFGATGVAIAATIPAAATIATGTVPAAVGAVTLAGIALAARQRHGPESQKALDGIARRLQRDWRNEPGLDAATDAQLRKASEELHWNLRKCMLDREALARTITDRRRFPDAATDLVMAELGKRNVIFLPDGEDEMANKTARDFARAVIHAAFDAAIENENWFRKFEPYALLEIARTQGETFWKLKEVEASLDEHRKESAERHEELLRALGASRPGGVSRDEGLIALARRIGKDVPDPDQALRELQAAYEVYLEVIAQGARRHNLDAFVDEVLQRVRAKTEVGDLAGAQKEANSAIAQWERDERERREASARGGIALLEAGVRQDLLMRDAKAAAAKIVRKVKLEQPDNSKALFENMSNLMDSYYAQGRDKGINLDLEVAIELARLRLREAGTADQRGCALHDVGYMLSTLGERETDVAHLEEAVTLLRSAGTEWTRESFPPSWALVQNSLGNTLQSLGSRRGETRHLEEAVAAYRRALEIWTKDRDPAGWSMALNNLGNALLALSHREDGVARLHEAVAAYRASLEARNVDDEPLDWAMTQTNMGAALQSLAELTGNTNHSAEAVAAHRLALAKRPRDQVPLAWANTLSNMGNALWFLGQTRRDYGYLEESIATSRLALEERTQDRVPLLWATTQNNLANALVSLGALKRDTALLEAAMAAYRSALQEWTEDRIPLSWALAENNLGHALECLGDVTGDRSHWHSAISHFKAALKVTAEAAPEQAARSRRNIERVSLDKLR